MRITEVMTTDVRTVPPDMGAMAAWLLMREHGIHHLVVVSGDEVVGVLSERDLSRQGRRPSIPESVRVEDLMTAPVKTLESGETVRHASHRMKGHTVGCLPITTNGVLVGIVTMADLLDAIARGDRPEKKARPTLSHKVPHKKRHVSAAAW